MKNLIFIALLLISNMAVAQKIKFPDSFKAEPSLFKGMRLMEIPKDIQTKSGITKNPGLVTDVNKTIGVLFSGLLLNAQVVYFEMYEDMEEEKMNCGFEVTQFKSVADMEKMLPKRGKRKDLMLLTLKNYLIILTCDTYKNYGERLDNMSKYFQQKLGAKLFLDRKKEVETSVADGYFSNLPPPLPPTPKNATQIAIEELDKRIANDDGLAYIRTKKGAKLAPGNYVTTSTYPNFETLSFTIDKDSLLHGDYNYHFADDYSKSPSKESKLTYDNGILVSEIIYANGNLLGSKTNSISVIKEGKDYLITIKTAIKNSNEGDKEIVTVFRNQKPISKITTRAGVSVVRRDFEQNVLEHYNNKGQLTRLKKLGLTEEYDATGKVIYKDAWVNDSRTVVKNGKISRKETRVKDKEQYLVTLYDEHGKVTKEWLEAAYEKHAVIADPDEYENSLSKALFEYYKKKIAQ